MAAGALACAGPVSAIVPSLSAASLQPAISSYPAMLIRLRAGEVVDMRQLREAYRRDASYTSHFGIDTKAASAALDRGRNDKVLRMVDVALRRSFVDIDAHFLAAAAYEAEGQGDQADLSRGIATALLDAILASGDGKTAASAYRVLSVHEEYVVANVLGLDVDGQFLKTGGGVYDVMRVTDRTTGERREIWFDISAFMRGKLASR